MAAAKKTEEAKMIKVTLVKSTIACLKNQKANVEALGLRKVGSSNTFKDDAVVRGMIKKVSHLVKVEEI
ncbi:MAG: 50S ribosomal protein L30 [Acutalibacteraceae bacterium]